MDDDGVCIEIFNSYKHPPKPTLEVYEFPGVGMSYTFTQSEDVQWLIDRLLEIKSELEIFENAEA